MPALRGLISTSVNNPVLANLLMVCILVGGFLCARGMVRETYPEFSLDRVSIDVDYPGAGPEEVERSICTKVEEAVQGVAGVKTVQSFALENHGRILVELLDTVDDPTSVMLEIKDAVEQITTFPEKAESPVVTEQTYRTQVINVAVYGDMGERTLYEIAREVRDELLADKAIGSVSLSGVRDYEIAIEISEEALRRYGLLFTDVAAVVAKNTVDLPAGTLRTRDEEITLRTVGRRYTGQDFEDLVLIAQADGTLVRLHQVATITDGFEETTRAGRFNGRPAAMVSVYKTPEQDASRIARLVRDYVDRKQATLPQPVHLAVWADASKEIDDRVEMLIENGAFGIGLVLLVLTLFLSPRVSVYVALGIPVAFAGALVAMHFLGETINLISLLALIMITGIVVDDAIVIADRFDRRRMRGELPKRAALEGAADVALPVLGSAVTTMIAFAPLFYVRGIIGKLVAIMPVVAIVALIASLVEAFGVLPAHLVHAGSGNHAESSRHARLRAAVDRAIDRFIRGVYRPWYHRALNARGLTVTLALSVFLLVAGTVLGGRTPLVLFPEIDGNTIRARLRFPEGTSEEVTRVAVLRIEQAALALNNDLPTAPPAGRQGQAGPKLKRAGDAVLVRQVYSILGEHPGYDTRYGSNLADVTLELMPTEQRRIDCTEIMDRWRDAIGEIPGATSLVLSRVRPGPTEKPLEIRLFAPDLDRLDEAAEALQAELAGFRGVFDIEDELIPGKRELEISLKPAARTLGLTLDDLARQVRSGFYGGEAVRLQRGRDEVTVRVRYPDADRASIGDVEQMRIRTPRGDEVPFLEVAELRTTRGYSSIAHQYGRRRCRVVANVDDRITNAEQVLHALQADFLPELARRFDLEYTLEGQHAQIIESVGSLFRGFAVALVAIYAILAGMLRSYSQPAVIMAAIPLGSVGAVAGHWIMGYDLTVMSLFGVVALSGVVVNDSLLLLDQINRSVRDGTPVVEAVRRAGENRFRAVGLTTITTVAGLLPLLSERSTQAQSLIPMAISLAFGLIAATVLTLIVVPAFYLVVNDAKRAAHWLRRGGAYPAPEVVEPPAELSSEPRVP